MTDSFNFQTVKWKVTFRSDSAPYPVSFEYSTCRVTKPSTISVLRVCARPLYSRSGIRHVVLN